MKLPRRNFLHLAAGVAAVPALSRVASAETYHRELRQKLADLATFARPMSPAETTEFIRREQELWHPVVKQIGISQ
jgi:tripartite-type tricarboxylate transporter receptor subunit TctC